MCGNCVVASDHFTCQSVVGLNFLLAEWPGLFTLRGLPGSPYNRGMSFYILTNVADAGCGPNLQVDTVSAETMDDALRQWVGRHGWVQLLNNALDTTYQSKPTGRAPEYHPAAPGRWYAGSLCLDGPAHHSREEWEDSVQQAVAAAQEHHRLNPPKLPEYASRRRYQ